MNDPIFFFHFLKNKPLTPEGEGLIFYYPKRLCLKQLSGYNKHNYNIGNDHSSFISKVLNINTI
jgi:hypothetical protein